MKKAEPHQLQCLQFSVDLSHLLADHVVVVRQVQSKQVIVDQPQHHVTCKLGRCHGQLRNLVGRELVQFVPVVHYGAHVRVCLKGEWKGKKKKTENKKHSNG